MSELFTTIDDLSSLLKSGRPLLDLRSPGEFTKGAIPGSVNIPLLDDHQRAAIGTCYKQQGEKAALKLGDELISGKVKNERLAQWSEWAKNNPNGVLFCWRGGLRSRLTQAAIQTIGFDIPRATGGYQKLRQTLINQFEDLPIARDYGVVCGRTGTGKTEVLQRLDYAIDLEGFANHKGSAFGKGATEQPTQVNFENQIALTLLRRDQSKLYWFEDESHLIGRCSLPKKLNERLSSYPGVEIVSSIEARTERLVEDYVVDRMAEYRQIYGDQAESQYQTAVFSQFDRIKKRLGGRRHSELRKQIDIGMKNFSRSGDLSAHYGWIRYLLSDYYDPMYRWQQDKKGIHIEFQGNIEEVAEYCSQKSFSA